MQQKNEFEFTYAAPTEAERREAEEIRRRYRAEVTKGDKLARLKALDGKARRTPMIWGLALGILGTLIFGAGMAMVLELDFPFHYIVGIATSLLGILPIAIAYPAYRAVLKKSKAKYAEEILRLSEEILKENKE